LAATVFHFAIALSDVDRGVYAELDLRVAQHPSETLRYLVTRTLGYCLSYEEGIAFSKGGLSDVDDPPVSVRDPTGILLAWIDVGHPSAERLHRASKAARRVEIYTTHDLALLRREASSRAVHKVEEIAVFRLDPAFVDAIAARVDRSTKLELTRSDGAVYAAFGGARPETLETELARASLVAE
jgi:uncharacterized protein YaeQ